MSQQDTILDDIFDSAKGWTFSTVQVPLQRRTRPDDIPWYVASVDGIPVEVYEITRWGEGVSRSAPAGRLQAITTFRGISLTNPMLTGMLRGTFNARGLPSWGLNQEGLVTLQATFPYSPGFPLDIARKQLMVCMGLVAEEAREQLQAWNRNSGSGVIDWEKVKAGVDWEKVKGVASVVGALLRAFAGF